MNQIIDAIYNMCAFLTEDAVANDLFVEEPPKEVLDAADALMTAIEKWDKNV